MPTLWNSHRFATLPSKLFPHAKDLKSQVTRMVGVKDVVLSSDMFPVVLVLGMPDMRREPAVASLGVLLL